MNSPNSWLKNVLDNVLQNVVEDMQVGRTSHFKTMPISKLQVLGEPFVVMSQNNKFSIA